MSKKTEAVVDPPPDHGVIEIHVYPTYCTAVIKQGFTLMRPGHLGRAEDALYKAFFELKRQATKQRRIADAQKDLEHATV